METPASFSEVSAPSSGLGSLPPPHPPRLPGPLPGPHSAHLSAPPLPALTGPPAQPSVGPVPAGGVGRWEPAVLGWRSPSEEPGTQAAK